MVVTVFFLSCINEGREPEEGRGKNPTEGIEVEVDPMREEW